jgi:Raf kinase inhibitor-like YbhB/YbcL family protein
MRLPPLALAFLLALVLVAGCGKPPIEPRYAASAGQGASITVTSRSFTEGTRIPVDHTCDGTDVMPELVLSSPPESSKSLVVYVEDPDASGGVFTHMVAFNLSPELRKLPSAPDLAAAGEAARFGVNDFGGVRYQGPCPPKGEAHRYRFRVFALDTMLTLPEGAPRSKVDAGMDGHILGEGSLMGHFGH